MVTLPVVRFQGFTTDLPDDVYTFTILGVKPAEGGDPRFDKGVPRAEFELELDRVGADGDNVRIRDWISVYPKPGPKTKLFELVSALLFNGDGIPERLEINSDELMGKRGRLLWGKKEAGEGKGVTAYLPLLR